MPVDLRTRIEDLYNGYQSGSNYVRVARQGTDYVVAISGSFYNRGRYKFRKFTEEGSHISSTRWILGSEVPSEFTDLFGTFSDDGVDPTPRIRKPSPDGVTRQPSFDNDEDGGTPPPPPVAPPGPPSTGNRFGEIDDSDFDSEAGYGEIDLREAIKEITGETLEEVEDIFFEDLRVRDNTTTRSGAQEANAAGYRGQGIIVAVIDTGINLTHTDIDDNLWVNEDEIAGDGIDNDGNGYVDDMYGWNTAFENNDVSDIDGHGSHVSGIIAAEDNGIGRVGVAPDVKIMTIQAFRPTPDGPRASSFDVAQGIYYAVDNGASVINLSLGSNASFLSSTYRNAIKYAEDRGVICVFASGNDYASDPGSPALAAYDLGIAVGSNNADGGFTFFANRAGGPGDVLGDGDDLPLYVTASGTSVFSHARTGNGETRKSGTSMAAPVVAGAIAVMLSADPTLNVDEIKVLLANTSRISEGESRGF